MERIPNRAALPALLSIVVAIVVGIGIHRTRRPPSPSPPPVPSEATERPDPAPETGAPGETESPPTIPETGPDSVTDPGPTREELLAQIAIAEATGDLELLERAREQLASLGEDGTGSSPDAPFAIRLEDLRAAAARDPGRVADLIPLYHRPGLDVDERIAVIEAVAAIGGPLAPSFLDRVALTDEERDARWAALAGLADLGAGVQTALRILDRADEDPVLRAEAAALLGRTESASASDRLLALAIDDPSERVRDGAMRGLTARIEKGDPHAVEILHDAAGDPDRSWPERARFAYPLARSETREAIGLYRSMLGGGPAETRKLLLAALGRAAPAWGEPLLSRSAIDDPDPEVRLAAVRALGQRLRGDRLGEEGRAALERAAEDDALVVRAEAVRQLER